MSVTATVEGALPPRKGACINLTLDATARAYDLTLLPFGGFQPDAAANRDVRTVLRLEAIGAACFIYFHSSTDTTLDGAATIAAGATLAFGATHCAVIPTGTYKDFLIDRSIDKFMVVKGSGAGQLRINAASIPVQ